MNLDTLPDNSHRPDSSSILAGIDDHTWAHSTDSMIARDYGVPQQTTNRYRKRHNKPACKYKRVKEPTVRGLRALSRRYTPSMTAEECAKIVGCDMSMWYYIANKYNIPYKRVDTATNNLNPRENWRGLKNDGTDSLKDLTSRGIAKIHNRKYLQALRNKYDTWQQIADAEGVSLGQVRSVADKLGVRIQKRLTPAQHTIIGYSSESQTKLAEKWGVSRASISYIKQKTKTPNSNTFVVPRRLSDVQKRVLIALINQASVTELSLGLVLPSGQVRYTLTRLKQHNLAKASHWENTLAGGALAGYWELTETGLATAFKLLEKMEVSWR